ncbi:MAG: hypothetical protein IPN29_14255 [Saprospiraceae bacterium]|nr:hypothetical protein [Saprospiraceae bacterium]
MSKPNRLFIRFTWIFQLLTAFLHSLSFLANPQPTNETEKQMLDLMINYKQDMGAGFQPTMMDLFTSVSACMTLLCLLGGLMIFYLSRKITDSTILKGVLTINTGIFGIAFVVMIFFAFLPPIICLGLIFLSSLAAMLTFSDSTKTV